uniref:Acetylglutamate kinase n=1 Tax=Grateloupia turuturu TaxID=118375 RepID=A0A6B9P8C9_9FLOR|nr:acetylglutamate kinase [Grateloupia turuturu]QHD45267.1 acetylglutamate kinase [Grateloupia turuturu]UXC96811.1 acetylglutamate kinase [Grateloupia turuturu]
MLNNFQRVRAFSEALPFIKSFSGTTMVIKYGGAAMKDIKLRSKVIEDILFLFSIGIRPVLVHGGGPMINSWLSKLNIESKFKDGIRVTDKATMEVVEMVLSGRVNKDLVALLTQRSANAIGLSGKDGNLIGARKLFNQEDNYVGTVNYINTEIIELLLDNNYIPVIASIGADSQGYSYNINADTVAGALASSLKAEKLILLTDTHGIMHDVDDINTLIKHIDIVEAQNLKKNKIISGGMIPKVECCIQALQDNVNSAHIINGQVEHALLLEILTDEGIGSMLTLN